MTARNIFFFIITITLFSVFFYFNHVTQNYELIKYSDTRQVLSRLTGINIFFETRIFILFGTFLGIFFSLFIMYISNFFVDFDETTEYKKLEEKYKDQIEKANRSEERAYQEARDIDRRADVRIYNMQVSIQERENSVQEHIDRAKQTEQKCFQQVHQIREEMKNLQKQLKLSKKKKSNATGAFKRIKRSKEKLEA